MATGMAPSTIGRGLKQLAQDETLGAGSGRKPAIVKSLPSRKRATRHWCRISRPWSKRRRGEIHNAVAVDLKKACDDWPKRCSSRATK
jgi:hypothetical protein